MNTQHQPKASNGGFRAEELGRRQFQKIAAQTIDQQAQAIAQLQAMDKIRGEFMADMSVRVDDVVNDEAVTAQTLKMLREDYIDFRRKQITFWQRLRWLLTGN